MIGQLAGRCACGCRGHRSAELQLQRLAATWRCFDLMEAGTGAMAKAGHMVGLFFGCVVATL